MNTSTNRPAPRGWAHHAAALCLAALGATAATAQSNNPELLVNARNDVPGPVKVMVTAKTSAGGLVFKKQHLLFASDDNSWSTLSVEVPPATRTIRLTFKNDSCGGDCPADPEDDRNAHIDWVSFDGVFRQAETFDRTGGPDAEFPGAAIEIVDGKTTATLGNQRDWIEFDFHPDGDHTAGTGPVLGIAPSLPGIASGAGSSASLELSSGQASASVALVLSIDDDATPGLGTTAVVTGLATDDRGSLSVPLPSLPGDATIRAHALVRSADGLLRSNEAMLSPSL